MVRGEIFENVSYKTKDDRMNIHDNVKKAKYKFDGFAFKQGNDFENSR